MKILEAKFINFKRFKDLTITGMGDKTKMVLLVGRNGCGKSSIFEGLFTWYKQHCHNNHVLYSSQQDPYFIRENTTDGVSFIVPTVDVTFDDPENSKNKNSMYFRTAYRNEATFDVQTLSRLRKPADELRLHKLIDEDRVVSTNYQRLVMNTVQQVYNQSADQQTTRKEIRDKLIGKLQASIANVFEDLILNDIGDPITDGTFFFKKGTIEKFNYCNLSAGEKAAFDLILDLVTKVEDYDNTIFIIDEPELHMHTKIQYKLIKELYGLIPENSQLWLSTHALGVMQAAKDLSLANKGTVSVLDLSDYDYDKPVNITPSSINKVVWEKFLSITLEENKGLIAPKNIIFCEGSAQGSNANKTFDADVYNKIFNEEYPEYTFHSIGCSNDLKKTNGKNTVINLVKTIFPKCSIKKLIDRDDLNDDEIKKLETENDNIVLTRRHIESYILGDDIIRTFLLAENVKDQKINDILSKKATIIAAASVDKARNKPADDISSSKEPIYIMIKRECGLNGYGSDANSFMKSYLVPLVTPNTECYKQLKKDIFDKSE